MTRPGRRTKDVTPAIPSVRSHDFPPELVGTKADIGSYADKQLPQVWPMAESDAAHVWKLIESISYCMLSTLTGTRIRSRPMGAFPRSEEGIIYFLSDARAHKYDEIREFPKVCLSFADPRGQKYVSISGSAMVSSDREKIRELWSIPAKMWWESPDDPNIRIIAVKPEEAEYWDAPGNLVSDIKIAFGMATGRHLDAGDHKKVAI